MMRIGAALFNGNHGRLADEVKRLEEAGIDFIHFDVYDGNFVSDLGFAPKTIESLRPLTRLPFEIHLGVNNPERLVPALSEAGADRILSHIESMSPVYESLYRMKRCGIQLGLALTLGTFMGEIDSVLPMIEAVLLLSRVTGEGTLGAAFNPIVFDRISYVDHLRRALNTEVEIQVAGSVSKEQIPQLISAGTDSIAFGGALYKAVDMAGEVAAMRKLTLRK
jgi:ribulose-phosphate 3-epimerase